VAVFDANTDWMSLLNRGLAAGTGLYDLFGKGGQSAAGINKAAAETANPFGSQFQQYQAPLAQTTLTPKANEFGAARSNLFGQYSGALTDPTKNQFGAGRSNLFGQYQGLLADPTQFTKDPFYQWQLGQGTENLQRQLAAKGMLGSGNALKEIMDYGQGVAGQAYGNRLAQLQGGIGTAYGLYGQDVSQLGAGADRASKLYGQDWEQLYRLSGATQGSPSEAGRIMAGRYDQRNNALANLGYALQGGSGAGMGGAGGGTNPLNQLINKGINEYGGKAVDWFSDLFGGGSSTYGAGDTPANLAQLYSDYGWGSAADTGGGSAVDSLSAADWQSIFGGGDSFGAGSGAAATGGGGAAGGNLAGLTSGYETVGGGFGGASAAGAGGAGLGATYGAGDTAANLAAYYGGQTAAGAGGAGAGAAGAAGAGEAGVAGAGTVGAGALAGMAGAVAWPAIWNSIFRATGRDDSRDDTVQYVKNIQSNLNTMGKEAFADLYMNAPRQVETRLAAQMATWGRGGQDPNGRPLTKESAKAALKIQGLNSPAVAPMIDAVYGKGAAQRYDDQLSAEVDKVWKEQNLDQKWSQAQSSGIQYPRVGY